VTRRPIRHALLALCACAFVFASGTAIAEAAGPTSAQIRTAIARVRHSPSLWATVNACNTKRQPQTIAVRAQMPALGFAARMRVAVAVEYLDASGRWDLVTGPNASYTADFGVVSDGLEQAGSGFTFRAYTGTLRGVVTFTWRRAGRVVLRLTRITTAGHHDADNGDPPHYSAAGCVL
jgi:hypothetical protein